MLHSSHDATLQMDFLVPIILSTFPSVADLDRKDAMSNRLSSHKDRNCLGGRKQNNRGCDLVIFNRTEMIPVHVGDLYQTQNVWWWW